MPTLFEQLPVPVSIRDASTHILRASAISRALSFVGEPMTDARIDFPEFLSAEMAIGENKRRLTAVKQHITGRAG
jgi:hypothetical protein